MKELIKNMLVPVLASRPVSSIAEKMTPDGIPVFMFHRFSSNEDGVSGHEPEYLHRCLSYLKQHDYHFTSIEQVIKSIRNNEPLPNRSIAFTIDDGFLDQATVAAPVFIEHQCPVTIFLISGMLDSELWPWDDQVAYLINSTRREEISIEIDNMTERFSLTSHQQRKSAIGKVQNMLKALHGSHMNNYLQTVAAACDINIPDKAPGNFKSMSWEMARKLEKQGLQFAPHSRTHRILSKLNDDDSLHEINHSWQRMKEELTNPAPVFCYPTGRTGDFNKRDMDNIRDCGLIGAVSTEPTYVDTANPDVDYLFRLPRFGFPHSFNDFIQYSSWIERAK